MYLMKWDGGVIDTQIGRRESNHIQTIALSRKYFSVLELILKSFEHKIKELTLGITRPMHAMVWIGSHLRISGAA